MIERIRAEAQKRNISRLCHFTSSNNFLHMAADGQGLWSVTQLKANERAVYSPTDLKRLDGHPDHICCSVQYPNPHYMAGAMANAKLFKDWVILAINPQYLWMPGTKFCARNAAAGSGSYIVAGWSGFQGMFAPEVQGSGRVYKREKQLDFCTTDQQAEVLVHKQISPEDILAVIVQSEKQAKNERMRLKLSHVGTAFKFLVSPDMFDRSRLSYMLRNGLTPSESVCD